jgi:Na+-driven multidrug efflux pump
MFLWLSLGTFFAYLQIGVMRFLNAIDKVHISLICTLIGSISQIIFLVGYYNTWELSAFALAMSININCFTAYIFQIIYIIIINPCPEASSLSATDGVTEDYWSFIKYTFVVGSMFFFTMLTFDMHPYIGLLLNVDSFVILNLLCILLLSFYVVCLGISAGNNLIINYLIGRKLYDRILQVFYTSIILVTIYSIIMSILFILFYENIVYMFTYKISFIYYFNSQKYYFIGCFLLMNYHCVVNETVSSLGGEKYSLISLFSGRVLISFVLGIVLIKTTVLGISSIFIGFIIGQVITLGCDTVYLYNLFKDGTDQLKRQIMYLKYELVS